MQYHIMKNPESYILTIITFIRGYQIYKGIWRIDVSTQLTFIFSK